MSSTDKWLLQLAGRDNVVVEVPAGTTVEIRGMGMEGFAVEFRNGYTSHYGAIGDVKRMVKQGAPMRIIDCEEVEMEHMLQEQSQVEVKGYVGSAEYSSYTTPKPLAALPSEDKMPLDGYNG